MGETTASYVDYAEYWMTPLQEGMNLRESMEPVSFMYQSTYLEYFYAYKLLACNVIKKVSL